MKRVPGAIIESVQNHSIALGIDNHGQPAYRSRHRLDDDLDAFFPERFDSSVHIVDFERDLPSGAAGRAHSIHYCGECKNTPRKVVFHPFPLKIE